MEKIATEATESIVNIPAFFATADLPKAGTIQCRWIHYPAPIKEKDDKEGYFPECLLAVNKENGQVLKPELTKTRSTKEIQAVLINLCKEFDNLGHCPLQISVPDLATESVLKAFCKALKIKLVKERRPLRELNEAWDYLHNYSMDNVDTDIATRSLPLSSARLLNLETNPNYKNSTYKFSRFHLLIAIP